MLFNLNQLSSLFLDQDGYSVSDYMGSRTTHGRHHKALYLYLQRLANPDVKAIERFVAVELGEVYSVDPVPNLPGFFWVEKVETLS